MQSKVRTMSAITSDKHKKNETIEKGTEGIRGKAKFVDEILTKEPQRQDA